MYGREALPNRKFKVPEGKSIQPLTSIEDVKQARAAGLSIMPCDNPIHDAKGAILKPHCPYVDLETICKATNWPIRLHIINGAATCPIPNTLTNGYLTKGHGWMRLVSLTE